MALANLYFAWGWFFLGLLTGAVQGLWFHHENWLGGYGSWPRRLTRLGHISFFGTGLLNLCFALTLLTLGLDGRVLGWASGLLIAGAAAMPVACYLAAWRAGLRKLFVLPVAGLVLGVGFTIAGLMLAEGMR